MDFTGKVTIVTGGALGIGGGISRKFSEKGSKIVIADMPIDAQPDVPFLEMYVPDRTDPSQFVDRSQLLN